MTSEKENEFGAQIELIRDENWKQRALRAEEMVKQMAEGVKPNTIMFQQLALKHLNSSLVFQVESYEKVLVYLRDLLPTVATTNGAYEEIVNTLGKFSNHIAVTLATFDRSKTASETAKNKQE